ncbi:MAG: DUF6768 family protein, partial [Phycisphaerales bacterium]
MSEFEDKMKEALRAESNDVWSEVEEQGLFEQAMGVMRGRQRFISVMAWIYSFAFFGLLIFCAVRFFAADDTKEMLAWLGGFLTCNLIVAMLKLWFWMQMDKNAIVREVKRLELQVATLAGIIKSSSDA